MPAGAREVPVLKESRFPVTGSMLILVFALAALVAAARPAAAATSKKTLALEEGKVSLLHAIHEEQKFLDEWLNQKLLYAVDVVTGQEVTEAEAGKNQAKQQLELSVIDLAKTFLTFIDEATHIEVADAWQYIDLDQDRRMTVIIRNTSERSLAIEAFDTLKESYVELDHYVTERNKKLNDYREGLLQRIQGQKAVVGKSANPLPQEQKRLDNLQNELAVIDGEIKNFGRQIKAHNINLKQIDELLTVKDLYITVTVGNVAVTDPFEVRIPRLPYNSSKNLDFKLNQEVDQVTINVSYDTVKATHNVPLQKKQENEVVLVSSPNFSQEGELGSSVSYDIKLDRLAEDERTFRVDVINLPPGFRAKLTESGNALQRVKFTKERSVINLKLTITVPDNLPQDQLTKTFPFFVIVGDDMAVEMAKKDEPTYKGGLAEADLAIYDLYFERLDLTPRGVGKFDVSFPNMFFNIKTGDTINQEFTVKNTGSVTLSDIRFETEVPNRWTVVFEPDAVNDLLPNKEVKVKIRIVPPDDVEVGKYELKVDASTTHEGSAVESPTKTLSVKTEAKTNLKNTFLLIGAVVLVILGVAIFTIRLSRR